MSHAADPISVPVPADLTETAPPVPRATQIPWLSTWILLLSLSATFASLYTISRGGKAGIFVPALAIGVCILAALFDARSARIPNPLTYIATLVGLAVAGISAILAANNFTTAVTWLAAPPFAYSVAGFATCAAIAVLGMTIRIGGGDLKLLIAMGALLGLFQLVYVAFVALAVATVYSILNLLLAGQLNVHARLLAHRVLQTIYLKKIEPLDNPGEKPLPARMVPLGVPFAIGLIVAQLFDLQTALGIGGVR
jgi:prepilin peptidase CpaA